MGFAAGFQVGAQAVERAEQRKREKDMRDALAQESGRYGVTEGAYGQGLQTNIDELRAVQERNPAQAAEYEPAIAELTRRQGLTAADYSVASGPTNFATRQEARQAAAPLRAEGLAGVYRQYGDVERADALEARAFEQQRGLAAEERAKAAEGRAVTAEGRAAQDFATGQTEKGLRINAAIQSAADAQKMTDFNAWRSQNLQADFATTTAKAQELGISIDQQFKIASNMTGIKEQAFKASQQRIEDIIRENPSLDGLLKVHKESKDIDPNSHFEVIRGQGGKVSLNRVNTATGEIIQPNVFTGNEAETTAYLNKAAMNPATIIDYTMNLEKNKAAIEKDRAYAEALGRRGTEEKGLAKKVQDAEAFLGRKLSEPEKLQLLGLAAKPRAAAEVRDADVISLSKELVNKPTGLMVNGKPTKHTQQTAIVAARQMLEQQTAAADPVDALIASMKKNTPAATQRATPAGQSLINLSNSMLPPAAPVQTPPTTRQELLRGLYLGQPRQQ